MARTVSDGFCNVCTMSWRTSRVDACRSLTYLYECYIMFPQMGVSRVYFFMSLMNGWSVSFCCLFAVEMCSSVWILWGMCVLLSQRRSWEENIKVQGGNAFKLKHAASLPSSMAGHLPSHPQCMRVATSPHPNRLLIDPELLPEQLFSYLWNNPPVQRTRHLKQWKSSCVLSLYIRVVLN